MLASHAVVFRGLVFTSPLKTTALEATAMFADLILSSTG